MKYLIIVMLVLIPSCMPLTTNSEAFKNVQKNLEIQSENSILIGKKLDLVSDKLGLNLPPITLELKDALAKLQADNDKKYDLLNAQMGDMLKTLAKIGLGAVGVPPAVTNAGITTAEMLMGGGLGATAIKMGSDYLAMRRRKEEHEQELQDTKDEAEEEKEKIRLRLEREKEELRIKSKVKERTMAKLNPAYQNEWDKCNDEAIAELKARGEI